MSCIYASIAPGVATVPHRLGGAVGGSSTGRVPRILLNGLSRIYGGGVVRPDY